MKKLRKNLLSLLIGLLIAFLLAEVLLRVFPSRLTDYNSSFAYRVDDEVGYLPQPNQEASFNFPCVRNSNLTTNSLGFRGPDWDTTRHPRIAVMGDSYLLGLTIPDDANLCSILRNQTGGEVMNTGVSGFGTYHELLMWRKYLAPRKPDVAVIFVFLRNDVRDNHCGLSRPSGQNFSPCCEVRGDTVIFGTDFTKPPGAGKGWRAWLKKNCLTCRMVSNMGRKKPIDAQRGSDPFANEMFAYQVYRPAAGPMWEEAWTATTQVLRTLRDETAASGTPLLVVTIPDAINLSPAWREDLRSELGGEYLPDDFYINYPRRRFQAIADSLHLNVLHTEDGLRTYRDKWKLPKPEFSYTCDGHWSPLGHALAADMVWAALSDTARFPGLALPPHPSIDIMSSSPQEILGDELYAAIYNGGLVRYPSR